MNKEQIFERIKDLKLGYAIDLYVAETNDEIVKRVCECLDEKFGKCKFETEQGGDGLILKFTRNGITGALYFYNELGIISNGELTKDFTDKYIEFCKLKDRVELEEKALKEELMKSMNEKAIYKLSNDRISISYIPGYMQERFDSKTFKEDYPELFEKYTKLSSVSGSVKITIKKVK